MSNPERLGAHEVAAWLRRQPKFLQQFPDLALSLVVPREDGPAASLASYQLEVLRDKNRELSRRLHDLFAISQENERLAVRTHQLTLALMRQPDRAGVVRAMAATLEEDFAGDLTGSSAGDALERLGDKYPTGGLVELTFNAKNWGQVAARSGFLASFVVPAQLAD